MAPTESRLALVQRLMPLLLEGEDQRLACLRKQWVVSEVEIQSETNWGFYADFAVPDGMETVEPPDFAGGNAIIKVDGVKNDAGCILHVKSGRLECLEVYTYDEPWESPPQFGAVVQFKPIVPGENAPRQISDATGGSEA